MKLQFNGFVKKFMLQNHAPSNKKEEVINKFGINAKIYMRNSSSSTKDGIEKLHPAKSTQWVLRKSKKLILILILLVEYLGIFN